MYAPNLISNPTKISKLLEILEPLDHCDKFDLSDNRYFVADNCMDAMSIDFEIVEEDLREDGELLDPEVDMFALRKGDVKLTIKPHDDSKPLEKVGSFIKKLKPLDGDRNIWISDPDGNMFEFDISVIKDTEYVKEFNSKHQNNIRLVDVCFEVSETMT